MNNYPLTKVKFLRLRTAGALDAANWKSPQQTDRGLQLSGPATSAYQKNGDDLLRVLEGELRHHDLVFTHNPWGEYGHEEHVQIFRVLHQLKESLGFELFVNTYVSSKSAVLMTQTICTLGGEPVVLPTSRAIAQSLKDLYLRHDCWTFDTDFEWPAYEAFYGVPRGHNRTLPSPSTSILINYLTRNGGQGTGWMKKIVKKALPVKVRSQLKKRTGSRH